MTWEKGEWSVKKIRRGEGEGGMKPKGVVEKEGGKRERLAFGRRIELTKGRVGEGTVKKSPKGSGVRKDQGEGIGWWWRRVRSFGGDEGSGVHRRGGRSGGRLV
jgi:hypothetical protein